MPRIFVTFTPTARENYYSDRALAGLRALGDVTLHHGTQPLCTDELIGAAHECEFLVVDRQTRGDAELFRQSPRLLAFSRCAVDIRNVDVAAASENGVLVLRASAGFVSAVAEWVIGVMIDLSRRISESVHAYRSGAIVSPVMGRELRGSTLGVVGYGQIGRHLCDLGLALGMRVLVTSQASDELPPPLRRRTLDELLAESDFVVCLAPANAVTENMFDAARFDQMRRTAFFINAARGELVDEAALESALDRGLIAGCALDVGRAPDQLPTSRLARHPKVIATPHVGGLTPQAAEHQALETVTQLAAVIAGEIPVGAVNAESATRLARLRDR